MVAGDDHGHIRVWLKSTGQQRYRPLAFAGPIRLLALSDDGNLVAFVGGDGEAWVRDLRSDRTTNLEVPGKSPTLAMAWAPGSAVLVTTCADGTANVWDLAARRSVGQVRLDAPATAVGFSADARTIVVGTESGLLVAYDATDPGAWVRRLVTGTFERPVQRVAVSPDGRFVAALVPGRGLAVWDVVNDKGTLYEGAASGEARDVAFTPDGSAVVAVDAESIVALDIVARQLVLQQHLPTAARAAAISVGEPMRVALSGVRGGHVAWIDVGAEPAPAVGHSGWVTAVVARGPTLFSCSTDGTVRRGDDPDRSTVLLDRDGWFHELELTQGDRLLVTAWSHTNRPLGGLLVLDLAADRPAFTAEGDQQVLAAALGGDGRSVLAANAPGLVDLVDLATAEVRRWRVHSRSVRWVRRLADGRIVTSGTDAMALPSVALWAAAGDPEPVRRTGITAHRSLAVVPGRGATIVVGGGDGSLSWWDLDAGREVRRIEKAHEGTVGAVAVSLDGRIVATGGSDRTLCLWDAHDGRELERVALNGSLDMVTSLRFDDQGLFVGLGTGIVVLLRPRS